ncbi:MAG: Rpn family recombination-promoting nuclease/putative transposase [Lachnospiraceae bacterium]|jgi:predicted transposase/invertase (TIGR01784 family)|nr:Rpn family recombination-promoting nuclease/putative transposase [Lachnospiraceae bacterium]
MKMPPTPVPQQNYGSKETLNPLFLSPLRDPVVGAIFQNVEHAGLAAKSLLGSILAEDGLTIEEIIEVTPQTYYKVYPDMRGVRVDVHLKTVDGKRYIVEVQIEPEPIIERNLFAAAHTIVSNMKTGTKSKEFDQIFPTIIVINILNFELRKGHTDFLQPVGLLYTKEPHQVADNHFRIYNIQLPTFRKQEHDLSNPLHAWLYLLDSAHQQQKSIQEVIEMEPRLKEFIDLDPGMKQFVEEYERATADQKMRDDYANYIMEMMRMDGMYRAAVQEGREESRYEFVRKMLSQGIPLETISICADLPMEEVLKISRTTT